MAREPFRKPEPSRGKNPFRQLDRSRKLDRCFNDEILPIGNDRIVAKDLDPNLYQSQREWIDYDDPVKPDSSFVHEEQMHKLFWDESFGNLLVLSGDVGTGKSTLVQYYLRCWCPDRLPQQFSRKMLIMLDAKAFGDDQVIYKLYYKTQRAIKQAVARVNEPLSIGESRRADDWTLQAFDNIRARKVRGEGTYHFFVLVLDNIDQCTPEVQMRLLQEIDTWRQYHGETFWRIIIPMWPDTLEHVRNRNLAMFRGVKEFRIGPLESSCHYARAEMLQRIVDAGIDELDEDDGIAGAFVRDAIGWLRSYGVAETIRNICNGDLRRELRLIGDFLRNEETFFYWKSKKDPSKYEIMRWVLLGPMDDFASSTSRIGNLLTLGHDQRHPRDMLIGWHLLQVVSKSVTYRTLYNVLRRLGYAEDNIEAAVNNGWKLNWFHSQVASSVVDQKIQSHEAVIHAYLLLATEPYYVDSIAPITPVTGLVLSKMEKMKANFSRFSFALQVNLSLEFIDSIRMDEEEFISVDKTRPELNKEIFIQTLAELRLQKLWRSMAERYYDRLSGLRESGRLPNISNDVWDEWLSRPIMTDWQVTEESLLAYL
jgi:hypothetical protein